MTSTASVSLLNRQTTNKRIKQQGSMTYCNNPASPVLFCGTTACHNTISSDGDQLVLKVDIDKWPSGKRGEYLRIFHSDKRRVPGVPRGKQRNTCTTSITTLQILDYTKYLVFSRSHTLLGSCEHSHLRCASQYCSWRGVCVCVCVCLREGRESWLVWLFILT